MITTAHFCIVFQLESMKPGGGGKCDVIIGGSLWQGDGEFKNCQKRCDIITEWALAPVFNVPLTVDISQYYIYNTVQFSETGIQRLPQTDGVFRHFDMILECCRLTDVHRTDRNLTARHLYKLNQSEELLTMRSVVSMVTGRTWWTRICQKWRQANETVLRSTSNHQSPAGAASHHTQVAINYFIYYYYYYHYFLIPSVIQIPGV